METFFWGRLLRCDNAAVVFSLTATKMWHFALEMLKMTLTNKIISKMFGYFPKN